jgi:hypothetical protein
MMMHNIGRKLPMKDPAIPPKADSTSLMNVVGVNRKKHRMKKTTVRQTPLDMLAFRLALRFSQKMLAGLVAGAAPHFPKLNSTDPISSNVFYIAAWLEQITNAISVELSLNLSLVSWNA